MSAPGAGPSATTRVAAVIGSPVRHSLSPLLLNTAFDHTGLDWVYCAFEVDAEHLGASVMAMRTLDLGGLSVTMPLKTAIATHLDELDRAAARLEAVNCVAWHNGRLVGHSTDGPGLIDTLRHDEGFDPTGKRCVVIGAGGAARAAVAALADTGAREVRVVNRTPERAAVAAALAGSRGAIGVPEDVTEAELVVNATPAGMRGSDAPAVPFGADLVGAGQFVFDMVYDPLETALVTAARRAGAHAVGGLGMLVHQAAHAFLIWTGESAPVAQMSAAARAELQRRDG